jgi:hypothetical protein
MEEPARQILARQIGATDFGVRWILKVYTLSGIRLTLICHCWPLTIGRAIIRVTAVVSHALRGQTSLTKMGNRVLRIIEAFICHLAERGSRGFGAAPALMVLLAKPGSEGDPNDILWSNDSNGPEKRLELVSGRFITRRDTSSRTDCWVGGHD